MKNIHVEVSDYLERNATEEERIGGYDIADYLIKVQTGEAVLQSMIRKNPVLPNADRYFRVGIGQLRNKRAIAPCLQDKKA